MKVLVTGAEGFVGPYLMRALESRGHEPIGTSHDGSVGLALDLCDRAAPERVIDAVAPDALVHLAAISAVPAAAREPPRAWEVNVEGLRELSRALAARRSDATLLFVSTGAVYGGLESKGRIDEDHPVSPGNSYAATKVAAESWLSAQTLSDQSAQWPRTIIARPFNHVGPGQGPEFALSGFARQIAVGEQERARTNSTDPIVIETGNLDVRRDFLDVRDVVSAYVRLLESKDAGGVFNICSGTSHRVGDLLDSLRTRATLPTEVITVGQRLRSGDRDGVLASSEKLRSITGWAPERDLEATLDEILSDWRQRSSVQVEAE